MEATSLSLLLWFKQECIPVGCVPAARRLYSGLCFPGGVSAWSRGCLPGPGGVCLVQGISPCLGGSAWSGGVLPAWGGSPCPETPPVNRITDTCKNITLATTSLRPVMNLTHNIKKDQRWAHKGPFTPKSQRQCSDNSVMTLAILFSLKTMESLQNAVATHFHATRLISMRTELQALSQHWRWRLV